MGIKVGIIMGKVRRLLWGLLAVAVVAAGTAFLHKPVTTAPQPAPATPTPIPGPLTGVTVCVDPGHGGYDGGAYGASGRAEKEINLAVARQLADALEERGARVILTRDTDTALADEGPERKRRDLQARVDAAAEADIFLSIHMNEYRTAAESGPQVFYRQGQAGSRLLAGFLQQSMNAALSPARPRSAHTGEYYLLEHLQIPAVLVECGFLSNPAEEQKLLTPDYQRRVAESIAEGVAEFAGVESE